MIIDCISDLHGEFPELPGGDPIGWELRDIHELLDHLYDPSQCVLHRCNKENHKD